MKRNGLLSRGPEEDPDWVSLRFLPIPEAITVSERCTTLTGIDSPTKTTENNGTGRMAEFFK